jgi:hypothetical protein
MYGVTGNWPPTLEQRVSALEARIGVLERGESLFKNLKVHSEGNYYMYGIYEKETN